MPLNLQGRSFLKLMDFSSDELRFLLDLGRNLKIAKATGTEHRLLEGKNIALIFEKDSTRTRSAFEVAAFDQGAHVTYLGPSGSHIGSKETIKDTARVLGRYYDAIEYRGFGQDDAEVLADYAGVPVYNGLTDEFHPTQILADLMTMREYTHKHLSDIVFCFIGDTGSNMGTSLMVGAALIGMDIRLCGPQSLWPDPVLVDHCRKLAETSGARIVQTEKLAEAAEGCDFIYTDVWVSMGESESVWAERIALLSPFSVTQQVMDLSGNPHTKFLHCLPAFHNRDTLTGEKIFQTYGIDCMEVTEEVFESPASKVFDQAENRLHSIKAVLVATIGG
ncbi:ornithine carbamoyltransferase [Roseibaca sp. Y0-43]|uniref:ornithine carbamoyltransferase n=1 Tax=Roseibaca sp. Y0-43 TaxID=2816854 RepID=UPI001D0CBBBC|nr:ornithine carbamoyltransferase [Roseibaca sp. Y0-43]MCC1482700.1 ornithine carbamoyltransferase [Roseibaca sp. Y0-43]